uniref:Uncharacterized protein n=1 Tax=Panagrolaimus davidi TaxID=227884 RepID=A0A914Q666_9BILA
MMLLVPFSAATTNILEDDDNKTAIGIDDGTDIALSIDDGTLTAICIDNDTKTARHLLDIDGILDNDDTAISIDYDTRTARDIVDAVYVNDKGWFDYIFDFLFPIGSAEDSNGMHKKLSRTEFHPCGVAVFGKK